MPKQFKPFQQYYIEYLDIDAKEATVILIDDRGKKVPMVISANSIEEVKSACDNLLNTKVFIKTETKKQTKSKDEPVETKDTNFTLDGVV